MDRGICGKCKKGESAMSDEEFMEWCELPHKYEKLDDYVRDVCRWLELSPWHYKQKMIDYILECRMWEIKEGFENGETVGDVAADVGFFCG